MKPFSTENIWRVLFFKIVLQNYFTPVKIQIFNRFLKVKSKKEKINDFQGCFAVDWLLLCVLMKIWFKMAVDLQLTEHWHKYKFADSCWSKTHDFTSQKCTITVVLRAY